MKHPQIKISIPEPCHEDWNEMTSTQKGKFCNVCTKEVIDFTTNSDEEIVKYFQKNGNVCGRFDPSQLDRKLIVDRKKRNHWLSYVASLLLPVALFSQETKNASQTTQIDTSSYTSLNIGSLHKQGEVSIHHKKNSFTVSGVISDDTGLPLPAATIIIKGTNTKVITDFDGKYTIKVKRNDVLVISHTGYKPVEFKAINKIHDITLVEDVNTQDVIVVAGYSNARFGKVAGAVTTISPKDLDTKIEFPKSFFDKLLNKLKRKHKKD